MAKLTSKKRNALKSSTFVFPKTRKFPLPDASHARNALARAGAQGGSVEAKVRAAVHRKFPTIGKMHEGGVVPESGAYEMKKGEVVIPVGKPADDYHFVSHTKNLDTAHVMETKGFPSDGPEADGVGHWEVDGDDAKFVKG